MFIASSRRHNTLVLKNAVRQHRYISESSLKRLAQRPLQSYVFTSDIPYLNLSIEHYLVQNSAPESVVLLFYTNRPCIVIGRNQNPWLEVNLPLLFAAPGASPVDLVRRRSGGGTVFHDAGNVNWSVISPPAQFTRDKNAEMVVRALRDQGIDRARVNDRHDIVLDQGTQMLSIDPGDTHRTSYQSDRQPLKVSGSAYKITRTRALHHGTCLLNSPNLGQISRYLHSPLKPHISAKGVESVSSPVTNIGLDNTAFIDAVQDQFHQLYRAGQKSDYIELSDDCLELEDIAKGVEELKSHEWSFLQTPQFTITSPQTDDSGQPLLELTIRYGVVTGSKTGLNDSEHSRLLSARIVGQALHAVTAWEDIIVLDEWPANEHLKLGELISWLKQALPRYSRT